MSATAPNKGIWIPIGASTKELNAALAEAGIQLTQFKKNTEGAGHGSNSLFESLKNVKKEAVSHNRVFNFYGQQLAELAGISKSTGAALTGMLAGVGSGLWMMAAVEGIKLIVEHFKEAGKEAKEAAEKAKKEWEAFVQKTTAGIESLRDKLLSLSGIDPETRHLAEKQLKLVQDIQKLRESDPGGVRHEELDNLKAQLVEVKKLISERREGLKEVDEAEKKILATKNAQKQAEEDALAYKKAQYDLVGQRAHAFKGAVDSPDEPTVPEGFMSVEQWQAEAKRTRESNVFDSWNGPNSAGYASSFDAGNFPDMAKNKTDLKELANEAKNARSMFDALGSSIADAFGAIGQQIGGVAGAFVKYVGQMIAKAIALAIAMTAASAAESGPWGWVAALPAAAAIAAGLTAMVVATDLIAGRQDGGPVSAGTPYIVGEVGPELFVPSQSGQIVPNAALGGGGTTIYNISTLDSKSFEQFMHDNRGTLVKTNQTLSKEGRI